jgi:hypothetical protein
LVVPPGQITVSVPAKTETSKGETTKSNDPEAVFPQASVT